MGVGFVSMLEIFCAFLCLLCVVSIIVPFASALPENAALSGNQNLIIQDNAELLSSLKTHVAYVGRLQQARMDGVIQYVDGISEGTGTATLRQIREDYLVAAFSIPVMRTVDEINAARD